MGVVTAVVVVLREQVLALVLRLRTLASHDSLTGALNRGAFEQRMDAELARARRNSTVLALVVFDVDHFKRLDDSFGHASGDAALRGIGDVVASGMRRSDVFGRLGGEEFGLLLPDTDIAAPRRWPTSCAGAQRSGRRVAARSRSPSASPSPRRLEHGAAMFADADRALYAAKRAGRDRVMRSDEVGPCGGRGLLATRAGASRRASARALRGSPSPPPPSSRSRSPVAPIRKSQLSSSSDSPAPTHIEKPS